MKEGEKKTYKSNEPGKHTAHESSSNDPVMTEMGLPLAPTANLQIHATHTHTHYSLPYPKTKAEPSNRTSQCPHFASRLSVLVLSM